MQIRLASPLLAAFFVLVAAMASAAPRIATDFSNMRSGPGAKWPVVAQIPAGAKVQLDNCGPGWKRDWCQVHFKGKRGFVPANTLAPTSSSVVVAPLVTRDITALRSGPGNKWKAIAQIPPGQKIAASGCQQGWMSRWCKVTYEGKSGYVDRNYLKRKGAVFAR
ncbi:SH3 domain-containing protein [Methylosinus sp. Sm6]|uniref:SH3 domain-containing protein n=1 Tax=Methylosinus sp. Sm6 TaxID=2866948 RepID=UPI001C99D7C6|nr:SH3 domain-containing protein [Methylosinus sp. Sm6]MBY6242448.1 SH3 domain-containing protein [Methylosinus sp. Sm6]